MVLGVGVGAGYDEREDALRLGSAGDRSQNRLAGAGTDLIATTVMILEKNMIDWRLRKYQSGQNLG